MARQACVLLSTYNGERFLIKQLQSLEKQSFPVQIVIRDDGSTDETRTILTNFCNSSPHIDLELGSNIGVTASFFRLVESAPTGYKAYLFADQDDIWDLDKVERAVQRLEMVNADMPSLYCTSVNYIDAVDRPLGRSSAPRVVGIANALVECVALGCTMALNAEGMRLLRSHRSPDAIMHDWWCYLLLSTVGEVIHDDKPSMQYRLHDKNVVGSEISWNAEILRRIRKRFRRPHGAILRSTQAAACLRLIAAEIENPMRTHLIHRFVKGKTSISLRLRLIITNAVRRNRTADQILLVLQLLCNDY